MAAYPNKKDFERLDKEQGDDKGGATKKNPLADVLEMAKRMKAAQAAQAQNNTLVKQATPRQDKKTGNSMNSIEYYGNPDESQN